MRLPLAALALAVAATPAMAAAPTLEAALATPAQGRIITRSGAWNCSDAGCVSQSAASRPMVQCQLLAKEVGIVSRFSVDGVAFGEDDLAACNKKAR